MNRKNWIELLDIALMTVSVIGVFFYFALIVPYSDTEGHGDVYMLCFAVVTFTIISAKMILEQIEASNFDITAGYKEIRSNNIKKCFKCGCQITDKNDSGWEVFVGKGFYTQPICKDCSDKESNSPGIKAE